MFQRPSDGNDGSTSSAEIAREKPAATTHKRQIPFLTPSTVAELCSALSTIFLILVLIGSTYNRKSLTNIYFLKIDVSNIIPKSFPDAALVNTVAQSLGLRDFYQVGLWNYCEGYKRRGVTHCSTPRSLYWFDPVTILLGELLEGATIALPSNISDALAIAKAASHWMFACYFVGTCFSIITLAIGWTKKSSKAIAVIVGIISFIAALFTTIAAVVSTVLYVVFRSVFESAPEFNIRANIGSEIFAFMWIAAIFSLIAFGIHCVGCCCCCCCCRRRKMGRKERMA